MHWSELNSGELPLLSFSLETFPGLMWSNKYAGIARLFMKFPGFFPVFLIFGFLGAEVFAATPASQPVPILPQQFAGWEMQGSAQTSNNAATADPTNAAVLNEYRFTDFASATYTRDDGRTLKIRAARFADASGAFGAYTFYLQPEMNAEEIGDRGSSLSPRVLFYRGHMLVDAQFSQMSPMSASELRELAGVLPRPRGSLANLPGFIEFMPRQGSVPNTQKYAMGPAALAA